MRLRPGLAARLRRCHVVGAGGVRVGHKRNPSLPRRRVYGAIRVAQVHVARAGVRAGVGDPVILILRRP